MGYQESLVTIHPKANFDKLVKVCANKKNTGFYIDAFTLEIGSIVVFKQAVGIIPEGTKAIWVYGERSFHNVYGLIDKKTKVDFNRHKIGFTPIESVITPDDFAIIDGIEFSSDKPTENEFLKRYSFDNYVKIIEAKKDKAR